MGNQKSVKPIVGESEHEPPSPANAKSSSAEAQAQTQAQAQAQAQAQDEGQDKERAPLGASLPLNNSRMQTDKSERKGGVVARDSGVLKLKAMGFDEAMAQEALVMARNDKQAAVNVLLDHEQRTTTSLQPNPLPLSVSSGTERHQAPHHAQPERSPRESMLAETSQPMAPKPVPKSEGVDLPKEPASPKKEPVSDGKEPVIFKKEPVSGGKEPANCKKEPVLPLSVVFMEKLHKVFHHKQVKYLKSYGYSRHEAVEALKAEGQGGDVNQALRFLMERGLPEEMQFVERKAHDQRLLERLETTGYASAEQMDYDKCQLKRSASLQFCAADACSRESSGSFVEPSQEALLKKRLTRLRLEEQYIIGDGNCQFRALSQELFGNQSHHKQIRMLAVQHLAMHEEEFKLLFASGSEFKTYQKQLKIDKTWGDELTLRACADALNVSIHVLTSSQGTTGYYLVYLPRSGQPLRRCFLTYHCPFHYNVMTLPESIGSKANPKPPLPPEPVERLTQMGFEKNQAIAVTAACGNDENAAIETLVVAQEVAELEAAEGAEREHAIERQLSGVRKLGEMGFSQSQAALALVEAGNDKEKAVHVLLDSK